MKIIEFKPNLKDYSVTEEYGFLILLKYMYLKCISGLIP